MRFRRRPGQRQRAPCSMERVWGFHVVVSPQVGVGAAGSGPRLRSRLLRALRKTREPRTGELAALRSRGGNRAPHLPRRAGPAGRSGEGSSSALGSARIEDASRRVRLRWFIITARPRPTFLLFEILNVLHRVSAQAVNGSTVGFSAGGGPGAAPPSPPERSRLTIPPASRVSSGR